MKTTAFCNKHLTSIVDKDEKGNFKKKCRRGLFWNEKCEVIVEKGGEK